MIMDTSWAVSRRPAASVSAAVMESEHYRLAGCGICVVELLSESFPSRLQSQ